MTEIFHKNLNLVISDFRALKVVLYIMSRKSSDKLSKLKFDALERVFNTDVEEKRIGNKKK